RAPLPTRPVMRHAVAVHGIAARLDGDLFPAPACLVHGRTSTVVGPGDASGRQNATTCRQSDFALRRAPVETCAEWNAASQHSPFPACSWIRRGIESGRVSPFS